MKNRQHLISGIISGCIAIAAICCITLALYTLATTIEWQICRNRMASELGVSSNDAAITNAWYDKLVLLFPPGTYRKDIISSLPNMAPIETRDFGKLLDGSRMELIIIKPCLFPVNSFRFLFYYSDDNALREIRIDSSD